MFVYRGYRWAYIDVILALAVIGFFTYEAIEVIMEVGISLASIAGTTWGFGTLLFIFLNMLPVFGGLVESEQLLQDIVKNDRSFTKEEARIVLQRKDRIPMNSKTVKLFFLFFILSGGLAIIGFVTQT